MKRLTLRRSIVGLALAAGAVLASCSTDHTGPAANALSQAQADSLGDVVTADVQSELDVATATNGTGFVPGAPVGPLTGPPLFCLPQISPSQPTNSDGDRVPDSVRITFTDCVISFRHGSDTVRGTIDIIDPTLTITDRSLKQVFTDFARIFVDRHGHVASITVNGARQVIRDSAELSQTSTDFRTDYLFANGDSVSDLRNWDIVFTADSAGAIRPDAPLPSGTLTINGSSTLTLNDSTVFSLQVSTPMTLHRDATCSDRPQFDTGTVMAVVTRKGVTATITIQFTACGQFTVTRS
jgi:hypothetical protein